MITKEDIQLLWPHHLDYLVDILNKKYLLEDAIEDIKSLIGSKYDPRQKFPTEEINQTLVNTEK